MPSHNVDLTEMVRFSYRWTFLLSENASVVPSKMQGHQNFLRVNGYSEPILDRIDLHIEQPAVQYDDLRSNEPAEPSAASANA